MFFVDHLAEAFLVNFFLMSRAKCVSDLITLFCVSAKTTCIVGSVNDLGNFLMLVTNLGAP